MKMITWENTSMYIKGITENFKFTNKLAMFDLDNTLITTISGKIFQINENDYKWKYDNIVIKLRKLFKNNYSIIIISNQAGIEKGKQTYEKFTNKLNKLIQLLNIDIFIFCSTGYNIYRKPSPTFFHNFIPNKCDIDFEHTFYCGDAAGRISDYNNTDYKFALNCLVKFITPEYFFLNKKEQLPLIIYPNILNYVNYNTNILDKLHNINHIKQMIIMVGFPASGKSTVSKILSEKYNYIVINQDNIKNINKCKKYTEELLKNGQSVIIDRTNPDIESRHIWINLANLYKYNIIVIEMSTSIELSKHNNYYRCYKSNVKHIPEIVYNIYKSKYCKPDISEGINDIIKVHCNYPNDLFYYYYLY